MREAMTARRGADIELIGRLRADVARHSPERYPLQRASALFHLGIALTSRRALGDAEQALREAAGLFAPHLPVGWVTENREGDAHP